MSIMNLVTPKAGAKHELVSAQKATTVNVAVNSLATLSDPTQIESDLFLAP
jgi:hypothetical protein